MATIFFNSNQDYISSTVDKLKHGKVGIFPTDTVYGIGCDAFNKKSINTIFNIKKRDFKKPINVLVSNIDMVKSIVSDISEVEYRLIKKFWPGPLTIIFKKCNLLPDILTSGLDTVGIRMPKNEVCFNLISKLNVPLATTSANISNAPPAIEINNELIDNFNSKVDFIIDGGKLNIGIPSTIVKVEDNNISILRDGPIRKEDFLTVLGGDINVR